jgi:hypothetical protein
MSTPKVPTIPKVPYVAKVPRSYGGHPYIASFNESDGSKTHPTRSSKPAKKAASAGQCNQRSKETHDMNGPEKIRRSRAQGPIHIKLKHKKSEPARPSVIVSPQDPRFADRPVLAAMVAKLTTALERRKRKSTWISDAVRAELYDRYTRILADAESCKLDEFIRWVTQDGRYLCAAGNFASFCADYLQADEDEARGLWAEASPPA